jgi:hypothetical protein
MCLDGAVNPTMALQSIETALRLAIRQALGEAWIDKPGAPMRHDLLEKHDVDARRRDGVSVSEDLLDYTMTTDLSRIIQRNWENFAPVFKDKKRTDAYFKIVEDIRNAIAHSRPLVPFEEDLVSGIAGQLRAQVTEYRSMQGTGSEQYYPKIERLTDSRGEAGSDLWTGPLPSSRLEVGDVITFTGSAFNARGNPVQWFLFVRPGWQNPAHARAASRVAEGDDVVIEYVVTRDDVNEDLVVAVVIATDADFHRYNEGGIFTAGLRAYDDVSFFHYAIAPPAR